MPGSISAGNHSIRLIQLFTQGLVGALLFRTYLRIAGPGVRIMCLCEGRHNCHEHDR